jgi:hypothetical protein
MDDVTLDTFGWRARARKEAADNKHLRAQLAEVDKELDDAGIPPFDLGYKQVADPIPRVKRISAALARLAKVEEKHNDLCARVEELERSNRNCHAAVIVAQQILGEAAGIVVRALRAGGGRCRMALAELDHRLFAYRGFDPAGATALEGK